MCVHCCILGAHLATTEWRRCMGCFKLQVSFCRRATNYRALLRKMTGKEKSCYASSPPSRSSHTYIHVFIYTSTIQYTYMCTLLPPRTRPYLLCPFEQHLFFIPPNHETTSLFSLYPRLSRPFSLSTPISFSISPSFSLFVSISISISTCVHVSVSV